MIVRGTRNRRRIRLVEIPARVLVETAAKWRLTMQPAFDFKFVPGDVAQRGPVSCGIRPHSLLKYRHQPHATGAKGAKFSEGNPLCVLCAVCVRLFQQTAKGNLGRASPIVPSGDSSRSTSHEILARFPVIPLRSLLIASVVGDAPVGQVSRRRLPPPVSSGGIPPFGKAARPFLRTSSCRSS